jgi:hypothetical protein
MKLEIRDNVKVYLINPITKKKKLVLQASNTLCQRGLEVLAKSAGGNFDFYITHLGGIFNSGAVVLDEKSEYADFLSAVGAGILEEVPILLKNNRTYKPAPGDVYQNNILELQATFTSPNTAGPGDDIEAAGLLCVLPGGAKLLVGVYLDSINKPVNYHLSYTWSIQFLVP